MPSKLNRISPPILTATPTPKAAPTMDAFLSTLNPGSLFAHLDDNDPKVNAVHSRWIGREDQITELLGLFGEGIDHVPSMLIFGQSATGKTSVVRDLLTTLELPFAYVNCKECYSQRVFFEMLLSQLPEKRATKSRQSLSDSPEKHTAAESAEDLSYEERRARNIRENLEEFEKFGLSKAKALLRDDGASEEKANENMAPCNDDGASSCAAVSVRGGEDAPGSKWPRCGKLHDFVLDIDERLADVAETVYFIADSAEQLCNLNPSLLPGIMRMQQCTARNVCMIFISEGFPGSMNSVTRGADLVRLEFPVYSPLELQKILMNHVPPTCVDQLQEANVASDAAIALYQNFAKQVVVELFHSSARDVREMMYIASELWPQYISPVVRGESRILIFEHSTALYYRGLGACSAFCTTTTLIGSLFPHPRPHRRSRCPLQVLRMLTQLQGGLRSVRRKTRIFLRGASH